MNNTAHPRRESRTGMIDRRRLVAALSASTVSAPLLARPALGAETQLRLGHATAFSFERLQAQARQRAAQPYVRPAALAPEVLARIDYEAWGRIQFDTDYALFKDTQLPVTFFHLGHFFQRPAAMFAVENGQAW